MSESDDRADETKSASLVRENGRPFWASDFSVSIILLVLFCASLAGNVFLGWKVKRLQSQLMLQKVSSNPSMVVGTKIDKVESVDNSGHKNVILLSEHKLTILYMFRPNCEWCRRNLPAIRALSQQRNDIRFIGLSTTSDGTEQYLSQHPLPFPVFIVGPSELPKLHYVGTPQTLEVSGEGVVLNNWIGAYSNGTVSSIETALHVKLPPIHSAEQADSTNY
jgi:hypothetical protein